MGARPSKGWLAMSWGGWIVVVVVAWAFTVWGWSVVKARRSGGPSRRGRGAGLGLGDRLRLGKARGTVQGEMLFDQARGRAGEENPRDLARRSRACFLDQVVIVGQAERVAR